MLDALIVKHLKEPLRGTAQPLAKANLTATQLTLAGAFSGLLAAVAIMFDALIAAVIFLA